MSQAARLLSGSQCSTSEASSEVQRHSSRRSSCRRCAPPASQPRLSLGQQHWGCGRRRQLRAQATAAAAAADADARPSQQQTDEKQPAEPKRQPLRPKQMTSFGFAKNFSDDYELGECIGKGSFGAVNIAIDRKTGVRRAVKTMVKRFGPGGALESNFVRRVQHEVDILQHLGASLNVAYCYGAYEQPQCVGIVMELLSGGELWSRIRKGHYSEADAARIVRDILRTVAQCHSRGVIVRDVKPENFLFKDERPDAPLRAIDFGLAEYCKPGEYLTDKAGTAIYVAPEVLRGRYTLSADIWSAGIIAYQLLTGRLPFSGESGDEVAELYMQKQLFQNREVFRAVLYSDLDFERPPWDTISQDARALIVALLQRDADRRPTAREALSFRWLQEDSSKPSEPLNTSIVQRLQRFGTYGRLKQVALRSVAHSLAADSEALRGMREMFEQLDTDGNGLISHADMVKVLQSGQFDLSAGEVERLAAQVEAHPTGDIPYSDWIAALIDWRAVQESPEWDQWIQQAFNAFDIDGSGRLSYNELNQMLCGEICPVSDTVEAAIREADIDRDGSISLQDFEALLRTGNDEVLSVFQPRLKQIA